MKNDLFALCLLLLLPFTLKAAERKPEPPRYKFGPETVTINTAAVEIVEDKRLAAGKGMTLKKDAAAAIDGERARPDLVFNVKLPAAGRYEMRTYAVTDEEGAALMKKAKTKFESMYIRIQIGDRRATKRVVYVPWDRPLQHSGKFAFDAGEQQLKIWLPRGVRLEYVELAPYTPPAVPPKAEAYTPPVLPPATHPRLWVNQQSLPKVKAALQQAENQPAWEKVKKAALTPYAFKFNPAAEVSFDANLETAAEQKAFYYLMTGDKTVGREAVTLMRDYLSHVEFGNLLDITREIGRAITIASEVYDWCYDLMEPGEKKTLYTNLMRLADDMEIGWPPFLQSVVNGHGNEAQVCRDLLSMSIAIYNEDPLPYKYTSYAILETLVPMRKFEYQSPRHNQGVNYGAYRFGWDMHAAWLFYRMTGHPVFDDNIKEVRHYWQYMRTPDGQMLRDGDGFGAPAPGKTYYWSSPQTMLLCYAYASDPLLKAEFQRQGGLPGNPVMFLLLNDPALKPDPSNASLPLTKDFGPVLGSMVARTGWSVGETSNDVVAEIKGGGYHFGNHQHADAGSMQLYYRGFQFGDLGLYKFYGTPYDLNFNKRSIAHSMMLAVDPAEKYLSTESNDGGTRFIQAHPKTPEEAQTAMFNNGKVISANYGPSALTPAFSYFSANLAGAYSSKVSSYTRSFCFLNMQRDDVPAVIVLNDVMQTANPAFKKYWQINAHNAPQVNDGNVVLHNERNGQVGKTHVNMLVPAKNDRRLEVLSGSDANSSFAFKYEVPVTTLPEANGHRVVYTPAKSSATDKFLTVFQVTNGDAAPLPVQYTETKTTYVIQVGNRVLSMSNSDQLIDTDFAVKIDAKGQYQVALTGLQAGQWLVTGGKVKLRATVQAGKNTIFFDAPAGTYTVKRSAK